MLKKNINEDIFDPLCDYLTEEIAQKQILSTNKTQGSSSNLIRETAALRIQHAWQLSNIKKVLSSDPYQAYVSLMDPNDQQWMLSVMMLGQRQSDFKSGVTPIKNPLIYHRDYHRTTISDSNTTELFPDKVKANDHLLLPLVSLKTTPIDRLLNDFFIDKLDSLMLVTSSDNPFTFVNINKYGLPTQDKWAEFKYIQNLENSIQALGLIASPWEIASAYPYRDRETPQFIKYAKNSTLIEDDAIRRLRRLANNRHAPTHKIAQSLETIMCDLPNLTPLALYRVNLILNIITLFYAYDYSKFSQHVYYIIHEISLGLLDTSDKHSLHVRFENFSTTSKQSFINALGLSNDDLQQQHFIVAPTLSGSHAHIMGLQLAKSMHTDSGASSIYSNGALNYYEFKHFLIENTSDEADVFCITTGPICYEVINPGIDINLFVKNHLIDKNRTKPATLLIDTTTTLYKNLKLNEETKTMVRSGQLSIIVHESHQKFGLLHTDQAQCGRMMAFCSRQHFDVVALNDLQAKAEQDYNEHLDLRIGVYISTHCASSLEEIKQQHFNQGASLQRFLNRFYFVPETTPMDPDNLLAQDERYFCMNSGFHNISKRHSFGHHDTTIIDRGLRISANASDQLDSWLETTKLYIERYEHETVKDKKTYYNDLLVFLLEYGKHKTQLHLKEQIIVLTIAYQLIRHAPNQLKNNLFFFILLESIIPLCDSLRHRPVYTFIYTYYAQEKKLIRKHMNTEQWPVFLQLFKFLFNQNVTFDSPAYTWIGKQPLARAMDSVVDILMNFYFLIPNSDDYIDQCVQCFQGVTREELNDNLLRRQALLTAINENNTATITLQLEKFLFRDIFLDKNCLTPLYALVAQGNSDAINELIKRNISIFTPVDRHGSTSVLLAAQLGNRLIIKMLLDAAYALQEPDTNGILSSVDKNGWSALHWTAFHGDAYGSRKLIQLNAPICYLTSDEEHPVHLVQSPASEVFEEYWVIKKMWHEGFIDPSKVPIFYSIFRQSYVNTNNKSSLYEKYIHASNRDGLSHKEVSEDKYTEFLLAWCKSGITHFIEELASIHTPEKPIIEKSSVSISSRNSFFQGAINHRLTSTPVVANEKMDCCTIC